MRRQNAPVLPALIQRRGQAPPPNLLLGEGERYGFVAPVPPGVL